MCFAIWLCAKSLQRQHPPVPTLSAVPRSSTAIRSRSTVSGSDSTSFAFRCVEVPTLRVGGNKRLFVHRVENIFLPAFSEHARTFAGARLSHCPLSLVLAHGVATLR